MIKYDITKRIASLDGLQVNMVSWNDRMPKLDIRKWNAAGAPMKGITLTREEFEFILDHADEIKEALGE